MYIILHAETIWRSVIYGYSGKKRKERTKSFFELFWNVSSLLGPHECGKKIFRSLFCMWRGILRNWIRKIFLWYKRNFLFHCSIPTLLIECGGFIIKYNCVSKLNIWRNGDALNYEGESLWRNWKLCIDICKKRDFAIFLVQWVLWENFYVTWSVTSVTFYLLTWNVFRTNFRNSNVVKREEFQCDSMIKYDPPEANFCRFFDLCKKCTLFHVLMTCEA